MTRRLELEVRGLTKRYSPEVVVGPLSFEVYEGEFFSLLGPSGCGKTTTLRCIAGFERASDGAILLSGRPLDDTPVHQRDVGLVFQNYALFPHLTVAENIAFGLSLRHVPKPGIARQVEAMLAIVGLPGLSSRFPQQLSGGQQQRVALARSLVLEPRLLLLDEPLSNLDLKLRIQMRHELRALQRRLRKTTVYVTHDQSEALALSDRIAVLSHGRIEQVGTPSEIYESPATPFVAEFIGSSNLIPAKVVARSAAGMVVESEHGLRLSATAPAREVGPEVTLLIRPERVRVATTATNPVSGNRLPAEIMDVTYLGEDVQLGLLANERQPLLAALKSGREAHALVPGVHIEVVIEADDIRLLPR
jgi:ABC-type Fe3+/spermidine/putrescine transport system ATPase subunit